MSNTTFQFQHHCLICLGRITPPNTTEDSDHPCHSRNGEISKRFSALVSRYLNLTSSYADSSSSLTVSENLSTEKLLCAICAPVAESFCQMYDVWFCLQLEMNRCLEEINQLALRRNGDSVQNTKSRERQYSVDDENQNQFNDGDVNPSMLDFREALLNQSKGQIINLLSCTLNLLNLNLHKSNIKFCFCFI